MPVETLSAPLSESQVGEWLTANGFRAVASSEGLTRYICGGLWVKNCQATPELQKLVTDTLKALQSVKDEHMPTASVVECGFLRCVAAERGENGKWNLHLFMRFTIDECPAGRRLAAACEAAALSAGGTGQVEAARVHHGGRPWAMESASGRIRSMLQVLTGS
jgi:metal-sulfur cluster biosynthetic enzyme